MFMRSPAFVCVSVLPNYISKADAASNTRLDIQISHDESWKTFIVE